MIDPAAFPKVRACQVKTHENGAVEFTYDGPEARGRVLVVPGCYGPEIFLPGIMDQRVALVDLYYGLAEHQRVPPLPGLETSRPAMPEAQIILDRGDDGDMGGALLVYPDSFYVSLEYEFDQIGVGPGCQVFRLVRTSEDQ